MSLWQNFCQCRGRCGSLLFRIVIAAAVMAVFPMPQSEAGDWSATSVVSESVQIDDNQRVAPSSPGEVYGSTTSVGLDITRATQRSTLHLSGGANLAEFAGPGATSDLNSFDQNANGDLLIIGPRSTLGVSSSFARRSSNFTDSEDVIAGGFEETIVTTGTTDRFNYSLGANASVDINRANRLSASVLFSAVDFATNVVGLSPTRNLSVSGSWGASVTNTTAVNLNGSIRFFESENVTNTESQTISFSGGFTTDISPAFEIFAQGGITIVDNTEQSALGARQSETSIGPNFDFGLSYQMGVTSLSASVSQSVQSSLAGGLRERIGVNAGLTHQINSLSTFSLRAVYAIQSAATSGGTTNESDRTTASLSSGYSIQLSRYWRFGLDYQFRLRDSDAGKATSNKVTGTFSREIVLLP